MKNSQVGLNQSCERKSSFSVSLSLQEQIYSQNNLTLCSADYFQTCWCRWNTTEPLTCPYLLHHVKSLSNSSYFCVYHTIRKTIECFHSSLIFPSTDSVSSRYISLTIVLFLIGLIGNGFSMIILLHRTLRMLSVYRNLTILCLLNIFYLLAILIRHQNFYDQDLRDVSLPICQWHMFIVAFTGHLCSWQLVSTSIQRAYALLSLQGHGQTSWVRRKKLKKSVGRLLLSRFERWESFSLFLFFRYCSSMGNCFGIMDFSLIDICVKNDCHLNHDNFNVLDVSLWISRLFHSHIESIIFEINQLHPPNAKFVYFGISLIHFSMRFFLFSSFSSAVWSSSSKFAIDVVQLYFPVECVIPIDEYSLDKIIYPFFSFSSIVFIWSWLVHWIFV